MKSTETEPETSAAAAPAAAATRWLCGRAAAVFVFSRFPFTFTVAFRLLFVVVAAACRLIFFNWFYSRTQQHDDNRVCVWSVESSKQATPVVPYPTPWPLTPLLLLLLPQLTQFIKKSQAKRKPKTRSPSFSLSLSVYSSRNSCWLLCPSLLFSLPLLSLSLSASTTCSTYSQHVWPLLCLFVCVFACAVPLCPLTLLLPFLSSFSASCLSVLFLCLPA